MPLCIVRIVAVAFIGCVPYAKCCADPCACVISLPLPCKVGGISILLVKCQTLTEWQGPSNSWDLPNIRTWHILCLISSAGNGGSSIM
jgi:hypothetical protein